MHPKPQLEIETPVVTAADTPAPVAAVAASEPPLSASPRTVRLASRIWLGIFSLFAVLALSVALCVWALVVAYRTVGEIRGLAIAERHAVAIGVSAREQYMHELHGVVLRDPAHIGHEHHWSAMLRDHVEKLRPRLDAAEQAQVDRIETKSDEVSRIFALDVIPAVTTHDEAKLRLAHEAAELRVRDMIATSDSSVVTLSLRTQDAMASATRTVGLVGVAATLTTLVAAMIAALIAIGFVRRIAMPVAALDRAAIRIGEGDFDADAGPTGIREFEALRLRFREMATHLRERETRLLLAERLASLGALAAGVAHELNNPLGVILGYLKVIRGTAAAEGVAEELRILDDEAQQCRRIVEDLVTFAREPRLTRASVDLGAVVRDVCGRMLAAEELQNRRLVVDAGTGIEAEVDAARIGQVLRNLVLNAATASGDDDEIDVRLEAHNGDAEIRVTDRGSGIDPKDLPHVFEPFYSRRAGGTGLGLAVCHGIVRAHGGTIELRSVPGRTGTTAAVVLPRHPVATP